MEMTVREAKALFPGTLVRVKLEDGSTFEGTVRFVTRADRKLNETTLPAYRIFIKDRKGHQAAYPPSQVTKIDTFSD